MSNVRKHRWPIEMLLHPGSENPRYAHDKVEV